jgi:hypothetical protein
VAEKVYRLSGVWDERMALSEIELRPSGTGEGTVAGVECDRVCGWCGMLLGKECSFGRRCVLWNAVVVEEWTVAEKSCLVVEILVSCL